MENEKDLPPLILDGSFSDIEFFKIRVNLLERHIELLYEVLAKKDEELYREQSLSCILITILIVITILFNLKDYIK